MPSLKAMLDHMDKATLRGGSVTLFSIAQALGTTKKEALAVLRDGAFQGFFAVTRCGTWTRTTKKAGK